MLEHLLRAALSAFEHKTFKYAIRASFDTAIKHLQESSTTTVIDIQDGFPYHIRAQ